MSDAEFERLILLWLVLSVISAVASLTNLALRIFPL